jgi:hypothetical protein
MPFPRSEQILELLREHAVDIYRPAIEAAIADLRDRAREESPLRELEFLDGAVRAYTAAMRDRFAAEVNDPPLRQALSNLLDALVKEAAQPERQVTMH